MQLLTGVYIYIGVGVQSQENNLIECDVIKIVIKI